MEIGFELSTDFDLINQIARHPDVFAGSADDGVTDSASVDMSAAPMLYLLARCAGEVAGFFALQFHNSVMAEIHTCLLPHCRGAAAELIAKRVVDWIFSNTPCRKLTTMVPACNRPALFFAMRAGLRKEGLITESFLKGGVLHDQTILGLSKGAHTCQP
jgi:RimJ/RimL family protein N-acetyltransferase